LFLFFFLFHLPFVSSIHLFLASVKCRVFPCPAKLQSASERGIRHEILVRRCCNHTSSWQWGS
jgi:hypothetical protein